MSDLAIVTNSIGRKYGGRWVVNDLNLKVPQGAVYGFLGLNGAGKSTTIRMLMGLIRSHSGGANVLNYDPSRQDLEIKRCVGYVAEQPAFYEWMTVGQICRFTATYRRDRWNWKLAESLVAKFRLPVDSKLKNLSKGQRAKTALVLALAFDPDMLILDEPTGGLDPIARREFIEGILAEFQESGKTIFISSHLVNELAGLVDHVGILHEGRLLESSRTEDFLDSIRRVRLTFDGQVPSSIQCEGLLHSRINGREAAVAVSKFDEEKTIGQLKTYNPADIQIERLNLEDAFVEYVGAAERGDR